MFYLTMSWCLVVIFLELWLATTTYQLFFYTLAIIIIASVYIIYVGLELLGVSLIIAFTASYLVYILVSMYLNNTYLSLPGRHLSRLGVFSVTSTVLVFIMFYLNSNYIGRFDSIIIRNDIVIELYNESSSMTLLIHLLFFKLYVLLFLIINLYIFVALVLALTWVGILIFDYARFFNQKRIGSNSLHKRSWRRRSTSIVL